MNHQPLLFVQPFGLNSPGGGSRILRALLADADTPWHSIAASPRKVPACTLGRETRVSGRPFFGRLENSRFHWLPSLLDPWAAKNFQRILYGIAKREKSRGIHAYAPWWDTVAAYHVAKELGIPFFLGIYDDPDYGLKDHPHKEKFLPALQEAWKSAAGRYVVCEELGEEMCRRWGTASYSIITDGINELNPLPVHREKKRLHIYFMGLFHIGYEPNLIALQAAVRRIREEDPELDVRIVTRCGALLPRVQTDPELLEMLPFASEEEVKRDLARVDLLYLPLSFNARDAAMARFSLSTKMISYLGAGLPILYHGPAESAAGGLLEREQAAFACNSLEPDDLVRTIKSAQSNAAEEKVRNARDLAERKFVLRDIRRRFWDSIHAAL